MIKLVSAYRTIGEVADILKVESHVIRYWEKEFRQLSPRKISGRRYYTPSDIQILRLIKQLLYGKNYTIREVREYFSNKKMDQILTKEEEIIQEVSKELSLEEKIELEQALTRLYQIKGKLMQLIEN